MKKGALLTAAVLLAGASAGCGSQANDTQQGANGQPGGQEQVELRLLWWGSQDRHDLTLKAVKLFEQKHPNIKVTSEYSGFDNYWDKLSVQVSGGSAPDVMQMSFAYLSDYANRNTLMDLNNPDINLKDISENILSTGKVGDKLYAIPSGITSKSYVYDSAMLEKAGVKMPERMTWDDLASIAKQVSDKLGNGVFGLPDDSGTSEMLQYYMRQKGMDLFKDGKLGFTKDALVDYFTFWDSLRKSGATSSAEVSASYAEAPVEKHPIITGKTAFAHSSANQYSTLAGLANRPLTMTMMPTGGTKEGNWLTPSMYWSAYSKTKHPKEAAMLVDFLVNDEDAGKILVANRGVPVSAKIRTLLTPQLSEDDKKQFAFIDQVTNASSPADVLEPKGAGEIRKLLVTTSQEISFKKKTIDQGAQEFMNKANDILTKMK